MGGQSVGRIVELGHDTFFCYPYGYKKGPFQLPERAFFVFIKIPFSLLQTTSSTKTSGIKGGLEITELCTI